MCYQLHACSYMNFACDIRRDISINEDFLVFFICYDQSKVQDQLITDV